MRIQTRFRPRPPQTTWTREQHEACLRRTDTEELLASVRQDLADFPTTWQRSPEMMWCLSVRQDELRRRGIDDAQWR